MCGEAGCLHCGFTSATSPSIVGDYYQLFNYSDDIYQGQLYGAASCRENGLSVLLLHLQAGESSAAQAKLFKRWQGGGRRGCTDLAGARSISHNCSFFHWLNLFLSPSHIYICSSVYHLYAAQFSGSIHFATCPQIGFTTVNSAWPQSLQPLIAASR